MADVPDVAAALKAHLAADATLSGLLADYGGEPAVFMFDPVPGDAQLPYLKSNGNIDVRTIDMDETLFEVDREIRVYSDATGDPGPLETIAKRVRDLMTSAFTVPGYTTVHVLRRGPSQVDEDVDSYVRAVDVTMTLQAES